MFPAAGKPGRKPSFPLKERTANERIDNGNNSAALVRRNDAARSLVDSTAPCLSRLIDFHRLFNLGRVSGEPLLLWQLRLAVLFSGAVWGFAAQLVWTETELVARVVNLFTGDID